MEALESDDYTVRLDAALALEELADERSVPALIDALRYEEWQRDYPILGSVRAAAARALGNIGDPRTVEHLITSLEDPDIDVRVSALRALALLRDERAADAVEGYLNDPLEDIRKNAITTLAELDPDRGLREVLAALNDRSWVVRKVAARVIRKLGDEKCLENLIDKLNDPDMEVRRQIILAVVNLGEVAVDPLLERLSEPSWQTRAVLVEALGEIGSRRAVPHLKRMVSGRKRDENRYVRGKVAEALGLIGDPDALESLIEALNDPYLFVRRKARAAIDLIDVEPYLERFDNGEISFRYPLFWDLREVKDGEKLITGSCKEHGLKISVKKKEAAGVTAEEFSDILIDVLNMRGLFNITRGSVTVDSEHGYMVTGETKKDRIVAFIFKKKGYIYYIYFKGPVENITESYKYMRVLINTLHVET
ncbi:HEAT repeat domain-containing protein [Methanothermobacter sp. THM-2]|uniref:HEAT repeat domain-containing protein n=1 Tax=Methanothermobacter sp. THM-2 TaxID=2606912 RepID=UPI00136643DC|nr:HEAT repeat domain-containing protein [Methanothermobacter sp. THM-2]QHN08352.1 HEAT repeat domain-containing protein [Methanothermobacter sp. THM-2]